MFSKQLTAAFIASTLVLVPAARLSADAGDFIAGAIIGGVVGSAVTKNNQTKKRAQTTYRSRLPSTQEGRTIQASLNYFGFNAGGVDGQLGRQSRAAISRYQAYMGYPATGQLTPFEYDLLTTSYNRAQVGGYTSQQIMATNTDGTRGLLKAYRAELAGQPTQIAPVANVVVQPQVASPQPAPAEPVDVPAKQEPQKVEAALPNFFNGTGAKASLASHCNTMSLLTSTNGYTTASGMTDPSQALNEQFCLARTYAISRSEELISQVSGFTPDQVAAQCEGFAPALQPYVAALSLKPREVVVQEVSGFILNTGMSPAQLAGTARICLGVGYQMDDMDVALGSALILFTLGDGVYGELMGHHLALGFGATKRTDAAVSWYEAALVAADNGAEAVFVPGQPERTEIIRKATLQLDDGTPQPATAGTLPVFSVTE
ncbi:MAG: peptidoglycan-binding domain-containing protein [Pseudomonadota bacterium]